MQTVAKLIHRANASYLPIAFPALYYGMPNGNIYVVYSRFYEIRFGGSGLEFVFGIHNDFKYDYDKDVILPNIEDSFKTPVFSELLDRPNTKIDVVKIYRDLRSYGEAVELLNNEALKMYSFKINEVVSNVS
jgi:hypothetical protein